MVSTNDTTELEKKQYTILDYASDFLREHLKKSQYTLFGLRSDGSISTSPGALRGNKVYAYRQQPKIKSIGDQLESMLHTVDDGKNLRSNEIFCTFTHSYNYSFEGLEKSWEDVRKHWTKIIRVAKKAGVIEYVRTSEAHLKGGCHLHCVFVLDTMYDFYRSEDAEGSIIYRNQSLEELFSKIWGSDFGYINVQGVASGEASKYIMKELGKYSEVETALMFGDKDNANDTKKIMTYYMAIKLGVRLISTSRGISYKEIEEDQEEVAAQTFAEIDENRQRAIDLLCPENRKTLVNEYMNNTTEEEKAEEKKELLFNHIIRKSEYDMCFSSEKPDGFTKKAKVGSIYWNEICDVMYSVLIDQHFVSKQMFKQLRKNKVDNSQEGNASDFALYRVSLLVKDSDGELCWSVLQKFDDKLSSVLFFEKYLKDIVKTFEGFRIETGEDKVIREWLK